MYKAKNPENPRERLVEFLSTMAQVSESQARLAMIGRLPTSKIKTYRWYRGHHAGTCAMMLAYAAVPDRMIQNADDKCSSMRSWAHWIQLDYKGKGEDELASFWLGVEAGIHEALEANGGGLQILLDTLTQAQAVRLLAESTEEWLAMQVTHYEIVVVDPDGTGSRWVENTLARAIDVARLAMEAPITRQIAGSCKIEQRSGTVRKHYDPSEMNGLRESYGNFIRSMTLEEAEARNFIVGAIPLGDVEMEAVRQMNAAVDDVGMLTKNHEVMIDDLEGIIEALNQIANDAHKLKVCLREERQRRMIEEGENEHA